ncbi:MAG: hypothetical protein HYX38_27950 [Rhodospirillales bacterium]|nr:hypothetical protein [Rhodospirillales bacterium]
MKASRVALLLLFAAAVLLLPSLIIGTMISHSSPQNLTWAGQFADQFREGILYPRTLPDSFVGLGGPGFYYYPPLGFWVDALLSVLTFNVLSVSYRLSLASLLLLWASGLAMHAWLKAEGTSPRVILYGALGYMAAPYHLLDHYWRGAYAEFAAYAVLPLVMLAVRHTAERRRFGLVFLAVAYAALPMAHLPTSLLISVTALPMYVLYCGWRLGTRWKTLRFFGLCVLGGALGLGLAAIYLIPALTLQDWIPSDTFWTNYYRIENWFLLTPDRWPRPIDMMRVIASLAGGYMIAAVGVLIVVGGGAVSDGWKSEAAFWSIVCIVCLMLIAGAIPWFWDLPFVAKVQFPWRMMIVVEFACISALCMVAWPLRMRVQTYIFALAILAFVPGVGEMGSGIRHRVQESWTTKEEPADLKQFQPAGYPQPRGGYSDLNLEPIEGIPTIACSPVPRICRANSGPYGSLVVEIDADAPTTVVLRRFYYPFWQLTPDLPIVATDPLRLVSFTVPAGRGVWHLERTAVGAEKAGWAISGLSLVLLLIAAAFSARTRSRTTVLV